MEKEIDIDKINLVANFTIEFAQITSEVRTSKKGKMAKALSYLKVAIQFPEILDSFDELKFELSDLTPAEIDLVLINISEKLKTSDTQFISELFELFKQWYETTSKIVSLLKSKK